jgi:hypothetical protein
MSQTAQRQLIADAVAFSASKSTALSFAQHRSSHTLTEDDGLAVDGTDMADTLASASLIVELAGVQGESKMSTSVGPQHTPLEEDIEDTG